MKRIGYKAIQKNLGFNIDIAKLSWQDLVGDVNIKESKDKDLRYTKVNFGNETAGSFYIDLKDLTKEVLVDMLKSYENEYKSDKQFTYINEWSHDELVEMVDRVIKGSELNLKRAKTAFTSFKKKMERDYGVVVEDFDKFNETDLYTIARLWKKAEDEGALAANSSYDKYEVIDEIYKLVLNLDENAEITNKMKPKDMIKAFEEYLDTYDRSPVFKLKHLVKIDESTISADTGNNQISDEEFDRLMGKH